MRLLVGCPSATPSPALPCCLPQLALTSDSQSVRAGLLFTSLLWPQPIMWLLPHGIERWLPPRLSALQVKQAQGTHPDSQVLGTPHPPVLCHGTPGSNDGGDLTQHPPPRSQGTDSPPIRVYQVGSSALWHSRYPPLPLKCFSLGWWQPCASALFQGGRAMS